VEDIAETGAPIRTEKKKAAAPKAAIPAETAETGAGSIEPETKKAPAKKASSKSTVEEKPKKAAAKTTAKASPKPEAKKAPAKAKETTKKK
jgi:hypothetical protein